MTVYINAEPVEQDGISNLQQLLEKHAGNGPFAVALNENFVPKTAYAETEIQEGDKIEIVAPMQGG